MKEIINDVSVVNNTPTSKKKKKNKKKNNINNNTMIDSNNINCNINEIKNENIDNNNNSSSSNHSNNNNNDNNNKSIEEKEKSNKKNEEIAIVTLKSDVSDLIGSWLSTSNYLKDYNEDNSNEKLDKYLQIDTPSTNQLINPLLKQSYSPFDILDKKDKSSKTNSNNKNSNNKKSESSDDKKNQTPDSLTKNKLDTMLSVDQKKQSVTNYHKNFKSVTSAINGSSNISTPQRYQPYTKSSQQDVESRNSVSHKGSRGSSSLNNNNNNNSNQQKKAKWGSAFS
ncbi:hypothetical protein PPL_01291 [Heterostelium album PN500]|uniref:Uncharacterized protein n=1 Tax=Heterostelium pallidum (strain ATCC 26659 / Pp 5 / PN500) TaxID=670386 RepID=D3AYM8_HETP5|nr:hypothetical protein PPL_01291 [Heterostelium album PN500]EFA86055.1 hypothetical protein PPL_01291 [Heterostelium album PN500]|eukprot:XP_020438161.1 hypothetical protein PPL_01291 [Heterostelium album PN500]